jgi:hypothetical protein
MRPKKYLLKIVKILQNIVIWNFCLQILKSVFKFFRVFKFNIFCDPN